MASSEPSEATNSSMDHRVKTDEIQSLFTCVPESMFESDVSEVLPPRRFLDRFLRTRSLSLDKATLERAKASTAALLRRSSDPTIGDSSPPSPTSSPSSLSPQGPLPRASMSVFASIRRRRDTKMAMSNDSVDCLLAIDPPTAKPSASPGVSGVDEASDCPKVSEPAQTPEALEMTETMHLEAQNLTISLKSSNMVLDLPIDIMPASEPLDQSEAAALRVQLNGVPYPEMNSFWKMTGDVDLRSPPDSGSSTTFLTLSNPSTLSYTATSSSYMTLPNSPSFRISPMERQILLQRNSLNIEELALASEDVDSAPDAELLAPTLVSIIEDEHIPTRKSRAQTLSC